MRVAVFQEWWFDNNSPDDDSAIKDRLLFNLSHDLEDSSNLTTNNNDFKVTSMRSVLLNRDHRPLNKNKQIIPLELFDS